MYCMAVPPGLRSGRCCRFEILSGFSPLCPSLNPQGQRGGARERHSVLGLVPFLFCCLMAISKITPYSESRSQESDLPRGKLQARTLATAGSENPKFRDGGGAAFFWTSRFVSEARPAPLATPESSTGRAHALKIIGFEDSASLVL